MERPFVHIAGLRPRESRRAGERNLDARNNVSALKVVDTDCVLAVPCTRLRLVVVHRHEERVRRRRLEEPDARRTGRGRVKRVHDGTIRPRRHRIAVLDTLDSNTFVRNAGTLSEIDVAARAIKRRAHIQE
jgi:chloramphenicol 3-O-phosphotransferase